MDNSILNFANDVLPQGKVYKKMVAYLENQLIILANSICATECTHKVQEYALKYQVVKDLWEILIKYKLDMKKVYTFFTTFTPSVLINAIVDSIHHVDEAWIIIRLQTKYILLRKWLEVFNEYPNLCRYNDK